MAVAISSGNYLSRTASLPAFTGYTACGWAYPTDISSTQFFTICGLEAALDAGVQLLFNNQTLEVWNGASDTNFASSPSVNAAFFWAVTSSASAVKGYWRAANSNTLVSMSAAGNSSTSTGYFLGTYDDSGANATNFRFVGRLWNNKVWSRELSAAELLVESYYRRVMFPASINFHWPLDRHTDTNDYSGNGRAATVTGTLSTADGSHGLWRPRRRIILPNAAAGGGTTIDGGLAQLDISALSATVSSDRAITANVNSLDIATHSGLVSSDRVISAALYTLSINELAAAVSSAHVIDAALATLDIAAQSASVSSGNSIAATFASLGISTNAAVVSTDRSIQAALATLTLAPNAATVQLSANIVAQLAQLSIGTYSAVVNDQLVAIINSRRGLLTLIRRR